MMPKETNNTRLISDGFLLKLGYLEINVYVNIY